jgi:type II secretory pathway pseudopilin PulG
MDKKIALILVLILIVALFTGAWLIHNQFVELQETNNELKSQINALQQQNTALQTVRITHFSIVTWPSIPVFGAGFWPFNVTIQNTGENDVNGTTLIVRILSNNAERSNFSKNLGTLFAGTKMEVNDVIEDFSSAFAENRTYTATLLLGDIVLDERTFP